ncbi:hypothetical protein TanjilG_27805 [Lupinus angustifolius]|uniref:Protein TIFY n=1 Tax=Lupinus angustifolius TaxID=3871 RepID=A0A4P1RHB6_LUPAN|nr:PREDICTED: protein TIFY 10B-like [Lupinus angustifolius]OIW10859.1 hypothetical protein TanjilG_27805 [Lupinus angustifolius]
MKPQNMKPLNLFSQQLSCLPSLVNSSLIKPATGSSAQMTIFYGGEVIVFDDCPAEKAKEIMSFATKGNSQIQNNNNNNNYAYTFTQTHPTSSANNFVQEHNPQAPPRYVACDLPLTRKASLYRFMEKRKDRINGRKPYQKSNPITDPYKPDESMSWLTLSPHSPQDRSESCSSFV